MQVVCNREIFLSCENYSFGTSGFHRVGFVLGFHKKMIYLQGKKFPNLIDFTKVARFVSNSDKKIPLQNFKLVKKFLKLLY